MTDAQMREELLSIIERCEASLRVLDLREQLDPERRPSQQLRTVLNESTTRPSK